jgi:hypothetical protein
VGRGGVGLLAEECRSSGGVGLLRAARGAGWAGLVRTHHQRITSDWQGNDESPAPSLPHGPHPTPNPRSRPVSELYRDPTNLEAVADPRLRCMVGGAARRVAGGGCAV